MITIFLLLEKIQHNDSYSATKAEGEALVMKSNGTKGLLTCCIRPSSIFGPGDRLLVPSLVAAARAGKSKVSLEPYFVCTCIFQVCVTFVLYASLYSYWFTVVVLVSL